MVEEEACIHGKEAHGHLSTAACSNRLAIDCNLPFYFTLCDDVLNDVNLPG